MICDISWVYNCDLEMNWVLSDLDWTIGWLNVIRACIEYLGIYVLFEYFGGLG